MLGSAKPRRLDERIAVSLETLIPPNHFYRHLEATLVWLASRTHWLETPLGLPATHSRCCVQTQYRLDDLD